MSRGYYPGIQKSVYGVYHTRPWTVPRWVVVTREVKKQPVPSVSLGPAEGRTGEGLFLLLPCARSRHGSRAARLETRVRRETERSRELSVDQLVTGKEQLCCAYTWISRIHTLLKTPCVTLKFVPCACASRRARRAKNRWSVCSAPASERPAAPRGRSLLRYCYDATGVLLSQSRVTARARL